MKSIVVAIIGVLMVLVGAAAGLWAGIWWAFIGGIVDLANAFKAEEVAATAVAIGVAKIVFSRLIGRLTARLLMAPGFAVIKNSLSLKVSHS